MSSEGDIRKLLKMRAVLEERARVIEEELVDLRTAMAEIDRVITGQGFRQSSFVSMATPLSEAEPTRIPTSSPSSTLPATTPTSASLLTRTTPSPDAYAPSPPPIEDTTPEGSSIQAKDGTIIGRTQVTDDSFTFTPREGLGFTISTPPWQSFLVERVLASMRTTDEGRAATGEIPPDKVLEYIINTDGDVIRSLTVRNFGGERRLREIQSSLRWSLDKMYDKMRHT